MLADPPDSEPEVILIATGSEVAVAADAYEELSADGVRARVVSLPSFYLFDRQPEEYRESVLPSSITARVSVEEASTLGWDRYVGPEGCRMLWVLTPPGFENLIEAASVPAETLTVPPPDVVPPANVGEIVQRYGAELLA